ncbi:MAG: hypothetical protein GY701_22625, partial [Sulfitobacter sp.]|nr:hypothetical protein [Sulfitobacter sp.]
VDLTRVERVFDSGIALMGLLYRRLHTLGAIIVFLSYNNEMKRRIAAVASPAWFTPAAEC